MLPEINDLLINNYIINNNLLHTKIQKTRKEKQKQLHDGGLIAKSDFYLTTSGHLNIVQVSDGVV